MYDLDSFRHTIETLSLKNGVDVKTLSSILDITVRALPSAPISTPCRI